MLPTLETLLSARVTCVEWRAAVQRLLDRSPGNGALCFYVVEATGLIAEIDGLIADHHGRRRPPN